MKKKIALWMYTDLGGPLVRDHLNKMFVARNWEVLDQPDISGGIIQDGVPYSGEGIDLRTCSFLFHMWADALNEHTMDILRCCESLGVKVLNPTSSFEGCRDKLFANASLRAKGISVPPALYTRDFDAVRRFFDMHGQLILKPRVGHCGAGILKISKENEIFDYCSMVKKIYGGIYCEKMIDFADGDYRAEIIGGEFVGGYRRMLDKHPFKTNMGAGGRNKESEIPGDMISLALQAAAALNLEFTIVDMVRDRITGIPYVIEANHIAGVFRDVGAQYFCETMPFSKPEIDPRYSFDDKKYDAIVACFERAAANIERAR